MGLGTASPGTHHARETNREHTSHGISGVVDVMHVLDTTRRLSEGLRVVFLEEEQGVSEVAGGVVGVALDRKGFLKS